jgi:hypothetical protein
LLVSAGQLFAKLYNVNPVTFHFHVVDKHPVDKLSEFLTLTNTLNVSGIGLLYVQELFEEKLCTIFPSQDPV